VAIVAALPAQTPSAIGDWQGTLRVAADEIHLTLHIVAGDGDALKATMDSAEQGAKGVPVTTIECKDSHLTFAVESVHGTYDGALNTATGAFDGVWSQGQPTPLTFVRVVRKARAAAGPSEIDGIWLGVMQVGGYPIHIAFHLLTTRDGLTATMDSPDQNATGVPVVSARREGDSLILQLPNIGAKYQGTVAKDLSAIEGAFTQGGASLPLTLKRKEAAAQ
jgi:hypothetical protein